MKKIFAPSEGSESNNYASLQTKIAALRAEGEIVIEQLPATTSDATAMGCTKSLYFKRWSVGCAGLKITVIASFLAMTNIKIIYFKVELCQKMLLRKISAQEM